MQPAQPVKASRREASLRALEVQGFKSFADDVRIEFNDGFTVVVGPNGSGKSNVVDAVKWILGEQSVKSLRGKEMTDVIFNGSSNRPPMNFAEASLVFDNARGALALDAPTVRVTRRVYRSGEAEYFLNKQPCRLRDIKELFAGTGVGSQAYSVIEQGRVDAMLQASPRDRRVILEEAAGVSRFKAKRLETQRRLERVEQNLLRLSDVVQEVDARLRTVRAQASKAEQYRELTERLKQLRTRGAAARWQEATRELEAIQAEAESARAEVESTTAEADQLQSRLAELDIEIGERDRRGRQTDAHLTHVGSRIASLATTCELETRRAGELVDQAAGMLRRLGVGETIARRCAVEAERLERTAQQHAEQAETERAAAEAAESAWATERSELEGQQREVERLSAERVQQLERLGRHEARLRELETRREDAAAQAERQERQIADLDAAVDALTAELAEVGEAVAEWEASAERRRAALESARAAQAAAGEELSKRQRRAAELETDHGRMEDRIALLEEWSRRPETLGAAADVIAARRADAGGPLSAVAGMLADLLEVPAKYSTAADAVLGDAVRGLVLRSSPGDMLEALQRLDLPSSVMLISIPEPDSTPFVGTFQREGIVGPLAPLVQCRQEFRPLANRLLGHVWVAASLELLLDVRSSTPPGAVLATLRGDVAFADGRVVVAGPKPLQTGLIARRSEIRTLRAAATEAEQAAVKLQQGIAEQEQILRNAADEALAAEAAHREAGAALFEQRQRLRSREASLAEVERQRIRVVAEREESLAAAASSAESVEVERQTVAQLKADLARIQDQWAAAEGRLATGRDQLQSLQDELTQRRVEAAKADQRLEHATAAAERRRDESAARRREADDLRDRIAGLTSRGDCAELAALAASAESALLHLKKHELVAEAATLARAAITLGEDRRGVQVAARALQTRRQDLDAEMHRRELAISELTSRRGAVAERIREDYDLDVAALAAATDEADESDLDVDAEIEKLRRRLNSFGGVNLEALGELDELESRYETLHGQYQDLVDAKESLGKIIARIDAESRRRFVATLEAVREGFRELFRKLFGGGAADLVLEEDVDVLEGGVEIVARPPGKELRSISLLSGGEKTLTCVALLLAIFRHRPSPFCLLDEVDAALDEPNIERFLEVLREFLHLTQFIVVTHSKRTMAAADALYGVTMQESGVSRLISVRFEELDAQGRIVARARSQEGPEAA